MQHCHYLQALVVALALAPRGTEAAPAISTRMWKRVDEGRPRAVRDQALKPSPAPLVSGGQADAAAQRKTAPTGAPLGK